MIIQIKKINFYGIEVEKNVFACKKNISKRKIKLLNKDIRKYKLKKVI